jgi:hypothetical protein
MDLSQDYVRLNTINSESATVEIFADDIDGDSLIYGIECYTCGTVEDQAPEFVTLIGNSISIVPTNDDIGIYDLTITISDEAGGYTSRNLHVEVVSEAPDVKIDFDRNVEAGTYDAATAVAPLFGTDMYGLYFSSHNENTELEIEKFILASTSVSISEMNEDGIWGAVETLAASEVNDALEIDTTGDGTAEFTVKYVGELTDLGMLNEIAGVEIFGTGAVAYRYLYKQLNNQIEFYNEEEYVHSYGNTDDEYYHSFSEFITNQQGSHWFNSNDNGEGGISFAEGSTGSSGTLIEVDGTGTTINSDAGTWEINADGILLIMPSIIGYHADAFKEVTVDGEGRLLRGDYQRAGEEEEFLWFNETGKDQFLSFLQSQQAE